MFKKSILISICLLMFGCGGGGGGSDHNSNDFTGTWETSGLNEKSNSCNDKHLDTSVLFPFVIDQNANAIRVSLAIGEQLTGSLVGNDGFLSSALAVNAKDPFDSQLSCLETDQVKAINNDGTTSDISLIISFNCIGSPSHNCSIVYSGNMIRN